MCCDGRRFGQAFAGSGDRKDSKEYRQPVEARNAKEKILYYNIQKEIQIS